MATIHFSLQGKGGVGKSFLALMLAMYYQRQQQPLTIFDTDPINATLFGFKRLGAEKFEIMRKDDIDKRRFDQLFEQVIATEQDVLLDVGANGFVPLCSYILANQLIEMLHQAGHRIVIHTSVVGGQNLKHTINGLDALAEQFPEQAEFVIWLNPFWGEVNYQGKAFEELKAYKTHRARISAIIRIPELDPALQGKDLADMLEKQLTFDEAIADESFSIFERQRLKVIAETLFAAIDQANLV